MTEAQMALVGAFIGGAIGIIGSIIGSKMSRSSTMEAVRMTEFNKAAAIFRTAFIEQLRELKSVIHPENLDVDFVYTLIENAIVDHEMAFIGFEPYLSWPVLTSYHDAWKQYSHTSDIPKETTPDSLEGYYAHTKSVEDCIHLAVSNIERLLKFANPQ